VIGTCFASCTLMATLLSAVDAAWYRMDDAAQHAVITALIELDGELDFDALCARIGERVLPHSRFRERVVDRAPFPPRWLRDQGFELRNHVRRVRVRSTLRDLVSELVSTPLDPDRPLWQIDVVEGTSAMIVRVHHCVADGIALVRVLLGAIDEGAALAPTEVGWAEPEKQRGALRTLFRTLTLPRDPATVLRGSLGPRKEIAWTGPVELEPLRARAHAASATLNDLITAAVAGGLRSWSREVGRPMDDDVRALVPVFIRGGHEHEALGNAFGLVYATLPVSAATPGERIELAKRTMDAITPEPSNAIAVLGAIGRLSPRLEHFAVNLLTTKASLVLTNVPGPPMPVHLVDREIRSVVVWAPVGGTVALGITAFTYRGELRLGVRADPASIPSVEKLASAIESELLVSYAAEAVAERYSSSINPR